MACGISKANIYHYYTSKDVILFDILDSYLGSLRNRICNLDLSNMSTVERFHKTVLEILLEYQGSDNEHRLQTNSVSHLPAEQQATLISYQRDLVHHMRELVRDLVPPGYQIDREKLHSATMSVFGMLNWFYMWKPKADENARQAYAEVICGLVTKGVTSL